MSSETVSELEKLAANGDANASCTLGMMYCKGDGADKDEAKGRKLLAVAAKAGNAEAAEYLADWYLSEKPENWTNYVCVYLRTAIKGGSNTAILKLADYYYLGEGDSNKHASLLYLEYAKRLDGEGCDREMELLGRMLENGWLDGEWAFFAEAVEFMADNGNRAAKHMIRRDEVPEPTDTFDFNALLAEVFELPEEKVEEVHKPRTWGRTTSKRTLSAYLYEMGIEFTKTSSGLIKTKKGKEIEDQIQVLINRGFKFKYSYQTDKWTIMEKKKE